MAFASMSAAKPGRGGRGYQPRVKNSKPQKTTESKPRFGTASPGKAGLGKLGNQKPEGFFYADDVKKALTEWKGK